jgi:hypothetical protein
MTTEERVELATLALAALKMVPQVVELEALDDAQVTVDEVMTLTGLSRDVVRACASNLVTRPDGMRWRQLEEAE